MGEPKRALDEGAAVEREARAHSADYVRVRRVGPFCVGQELARGGMASVHVATLDPAARTSATPEPEVFAIKIVLAERADDGDFVEMFFDEVRIASRIRHENVCAVYRFGEVDDALYLTMPLLDGVQLGALRRAAVAAGVIGDPRWQRIAVRIVSDACAGLHAAHELTDDAGAPLAVVHRDVSPQNVFVCRDGVTKVLDFGIARAAHRIHATNVGVVKGKFAYIAPEQILGGEVDRRADVWSLSVLLWELLAGEPLFRRSTDLDTIGAVLRPAVPPIAGVDDELFAIVREALRSEARLRHPTAMALRDALERWLARVGGARTSDVGRIVQQLAPRDEPRKSRRHSRPPRRAPSPLPERAPARDGRDPTVPLVPRRRDGARSDLRDTVDEGRGNPATGPPRRRAIARAAIVGPTLLAIAIAIAVYLFATR